MRVFRSSRARPVTHQNVHLRRGAHRSPEDGACVVELASMLAGEPFSDTPRCVCPALRSFLHGYNDHLPDRLRQDLYAIAGEVVGTRSCGDVLRWRVRAIQAFAEAAAPQYRALPATSLAGCQFAGELAARAARRSPEQHARTLAFVRSLLEPPEEAAIAPRGPAAAAAAAGPAAHP